ncbi:hypothetical protein VBD025_06620 [Virgibacillus flavescens]|uniref:hypothetical protein n=1 Tax=Virgibacillus flavescens TaxID=1611422 RepID=UPI003D325F24
MKAQDLVQCPDGCCQGDELLCLSIPCPVSIVILGLELQLELPCLKLTSPNDLTQEQTQQVRNVLTNLLQNLGTTAAQ